MTPTRRAFLGSILGAVALASPFGLRCRRTEPTPKPGQGVRLFLMGAESGRDEVLLPLERSGYIRVIKPDHLAGQWARPLTFSQERADAPTVHLVQTIEALDATAVGRLLEARGESLSQTIRRLS